MAENITGIRLRLGFFEDFEVFAGLVRDTGARRISSRDFVLDQDMKIEQVVSLVRLLRRSERDANHPVSVETFPPLPSSHYRGQSEDLYDWWGTVADRKWEQPDS